MKKVSRPPAVQLSLMVEPAVGKYLRHTHPGDVYLVNARHPLGCWLINALARKNTIQRLDQDTAWAKKYIADLTYEFRFAVPLWCLDKIGTYIPAQNTFYFNQYILKLMYTELMINVVYHHGLRAQGEIQECIELFRAKYNLYEKEFPDERLRKKYLRLRNRYNKTGSFAELFSPGELLWRM